MFEKRKTLDFVLSLFVLGGLLTGLVFHTLPAAAGEQDPSPRYVAYYFLTNKRCKSCFLIEK